MVVAIMGIVSYQIKCISVCAMMDGKAKAVLFT